MALLLKGGRVVDPAVGLDEVADVLIRDGVIVEIGAGPEDPEGRDGRLRREDRAAGPRGRARAPARAGPRGRGDGRERARAPRRTAASPPSARCRTPSRSRDEGSAVRFLVRARGRRRRGARATRSARSRSGRRARRSPRSATWSPRARSRSPTTAAACRTPGMMRLAMDYASASPSPIVAHCEDESLAGKRRRERGRRLDAHGAARLARRRRGDHGRARHRARRAHRLPRCTSRTSRPPAPSSSSARRRRAGVAVTCEVTPHHLFLTEDDIASYDTNLKMNPPLRDREDARRRCSRGCSTARSTASPPTTRRTRRTRRSSSSSSRRSARPGSRRRCRSSCTNLVAAGQGRLGRRGRAGCATARARRSGCPRCASRPGCPADITIVDPEARVEVDAPSGSRRARATRRSWVRDCSARRARCSWGATSRCGTGRWSPSGRSDDARAVLALEDGTCFAGWACGADGESRRRGRLQHVA